MDGLRVLGSMFIRPERTYWDEFDKLIGGRSKKHFYMELGIELQKIYNSEINVEIGWFWDDGNRVQLGDQMNGYLAEETVGSVSDIIPWLQEAIAHFYPESEYAAALDAEIRPQAGPRIFCPSRMCLRI